VERRVVKTAGGEKEREQRNGGSRETAGKRKDAAVNGVNGGNVACTLRELETYDATSPL